jgi:hypothetical protein
VLILLILPFAIAYLVFKKIKDPENFNDEKHSFVFSELSMQSFWQAIFNLVFIFRRIAFVCILIFIHGSLGLQLMAHLFLSLLYAAYIIGL